MTRNHDGGGYNLRIRPATVATVLLGCLAIILSGCSSSGDEGRKGTFSAPARTEDSSTVLPSVDGSTTRQPSPLPPDPRSATGEQEAGRNAPAKGTVPPSIGPRKSVSPAVQAQSVPSVTVEKLPGYVTPAEYLMIPSENFPDSTVVVMLPRDYYDQPKKRYPLVIAFGGAGECAKPPRQGALAWLRDYKTDEAARALDRGTLETKDFRGLVSEKQLRDFNRRLKQRPYGGVILACPSSPRLSPLSRLEFPEYEAFIMQDLIPQLARRYRTIPDEIGIDGVSMGGARSMYYGFKYPEVFSSIGSVQGAFGPYMELYRDLVHKNRDMLTHRAIQLVTSDGDVMARSVDHLHRMLAGDRIPHTHLVLTGPHDYIFNQGPGALALLMFHHQAQRGQHAAEREGRGMIFATAREHMERGLAQGLFTGAVLRVSRNGEPLLHECYGTLGGPGTPPVTPKTLFDLASLTKVLGTTPCWLRLASENPGILDQPLHTWFPDAPADKHSITPRHLLAHSSGLPAWLPYYLLSPDWSVNRLTTEKIFQVDLVYPPGHGCLYSDLGFIVLAAIAEKETGRSLERLVREDVLTPLQLADDLVFRPIDQTHRIAWTREGESPGLVNDLNARSLGGVSGHAGLFGTADAVAAVAEELLKSLTSTGTVFDPGTVRVFCRRAHLVEGSTRTLGFDTPSEEGSTSGKYFSAESVGHTGFTGTSLWIDPHKGIVVVLLTNRVFMGESDTRIKTFRPEIHDAVMQEIGGCRGPQCFPKFTAR